MKRFLLIFFIGFLSYNSFTQIHICGTKDDGSMMARLIENKKYMESHLGLRGDNDWIYIPVQFHIVSDANGVGGVEERKIIDELCTINKNYSPNKMKFYLTPDFSYVKYNPLYNDPGSDFAEAKIKTSKNKNALNIFIVNDIPSGSGFGQVLGYYSPILDIIVIRKNQIGVNQQTVSHEIGHFFSLQHPFYGWEETPYDAAVHGNPLKIQKIKWGGINFDIELVNRSNCNDAADKICDTPPDYNFGIVDPEQNCKLNGPILDYNKDTIKTQENNYMSYFFNCGKYQFTPMQVSAMRADFLSNLRSYIRTGVVPDTTAINAADFKVVSPLENETTPFYDEVTLDWQDMPGATHYLVSIFPPSAPNNIKYFFVKGVSKVIVKDLEKNKKYTWHVKPYNVGNTCTNKLGPANFKTGNYTVGIEEELTAGEDMQVFPNPVNDNLFYVFSKNAHTRTDLKMYNSLGQLVDSWSMDIGIGTNSINLTKSNYQKGFYNLILKTKDRDYIRRLIIQ
ncbi:MAG: zinc-dependent metalloprotease [Deltaproteobacteria bacterium]